MRGPGFYDPRRYVASCSSHGLTAKVDVLGQVAVLDACDTLVAMIHDVVMSAIAFIAAVVLRMGVEAFEQVPQVLGLGTVIFCTVAATVFWWTGLYRGVWRYASLDDIIAILKAVTLAVLLFVAALFLITVTGVLLFGAMVGLSKLALSNWHESEIGAEA